MFEGSKTTMVVLVVLVAACSGGARSSTTSTAPVERTTTTATNTTSEAPTTTTSPAAPDDSPEILGRRAATLGRLALTPGVYRHDLGVVPVDFAFDAPGWDLVIVADRFIALGHQEAPIAPFVTFTPAATVDELVEEVSTHPEAIESTAPSPFEVGNLSGVMFEVLFGGSPVGRGGPFPCNGPPLSEELDIDGGSVSSFVVGCSWNRFWIGAVGAGAVIVHIGNIEGSPDQAGSLDELEPLIDEFLAAITFDP